MLGIKVMIGKHTINSQSCIDVLYLFNSEYFFHISLIEFDAVSG